MLYAPLREKVESFLAHLHKNTCLSACWCTFSRPDMNFSSTLLHLLFFSQHLVWILGLKPGVGGALKPGRAVEGPSTVSVFYNLCIELVLHIMFPSSLLKVMGLIVCLQPKQVLTTAVMTDLPVISNILSRLFESSQ